MRRSVVARRPISMDQPELPENQAFMTISKSVLEAPVNDHGGIRFFSSGEGATAGPDDENQYLEQKPDVGISSLAELVRQIAWHVHGRVHSSIEIEDLIQIGHFGLVTAAQNYTLQEGATFASYAGIGIRGAIIDHLRKSSNLCRTTIEMQKKANAAGRELRSRMTRPTWPRWLNIWTCPRKRCMAGNMRETTHQSLDVYDDFSVVYIARKYT